MNCRMLVVFMAIAFVLAMSPMMAAPGNSISITDLSGTSQSNRPFSISRVFAAGEILHYAQARLNGTALTTQCDVKTRWPDGSVQHAIVSFLATLPANETVTVDFIDQASGNNAGQLTVDGMLSSSYNFGGQIQVINSAGQSFTATARDMLKAGAYRYWLQGPVCTQVIIEDRSPTTTYDIGWTTTVKGQTYNEKSLHPIFVATFYPGWSGVKVESIMENDWTTRLQDMTYSLALRTGNPLNSTPAYSKSTFTHFAFTRWREVFWSGPEPGQVKIDYNLPYMIYSKALPNYDTSKVVSASAVSSEVSAFNATDKGDINGNAEWLKYFGATGGRPDIGLVPRWYVRYLYTFDPQLYDVMLGNAAASGYVPIHFRESITGRMYANLSSISGSPAYNADAFGRPVSIDARPTVRLAVRALDGATNDFITPLGCNSPYPVDACGVFASSGWDPDLAHQPGMVYVPYLITGDWYFLEELYFWAAWNVSTTGPAQRNNDWGYIDGLEQVRGEAWALRNLAHAAFAAPDGSPEKAYFTKKVAHNIAMREGKLNITNGAFANSAEVNWVRTSTADRPGVAGYHYWPNDKNNPLMYLGYAWSSDPVNNASMPTSTKYSVAPWQVHFNYVVFGHMEELGFPIGPLKQNALKFLIHELTDTAYNPWLTAVYEMPAMGCFEASKNLAACPANGFDFFQTWATVKGNSTPSKASATSWPENDQGDVEHGYPHIARAAASYLPGLSDGSLTGQNAWDWINDAARNVSNQSALNDNPKWAILPRTAVTPSPSPGGSACDLTGDGAVDSNDVQNAIGQALGTATCGSADLDRSGRCDVIDVQRVINSAIGGSCRVGQ